MNKLNIKDICTNEELEKINSAAINITTYCQNKGLIPLEFVYMLLHLLTSIKETDSDLNTGLGLIIDLYTRD